MYFNSIEGDFFNRCLEGESPKTFPSHCRDLKLGNNTEFAFKFLKNVSTKSLGFC